MFILKPALLLLGAQLAQRAEPVLYVVGFRHLAICDDLDVDGHHSEAFAGMGNAEQPRWRA
jgi:hypothetical protein